MQTVEMMRTKGQDTVRRWSAKINEQPDEFKTWGITAGSALVGALTVTAVAKGVVAVISTLASPPVALTVGAVGGGILSWNYMQGRLSTAGSGYGASDEQTVALPLEEVPIMTMDALNTGVTEPVGMDMNAIPDNLEVISGIGPVYASRLHAAGIYTYSQLAELTSERIHKIIAPVRSSHMIDAARWITEAQQLAARDSTAT
ncbi:MAG: hypothetical protein R3A44_39730 [Caldilineaceae bacterium]